MTPSFRFILSKGSRKYLCPDCGKRRFVPYLDTHSGLLLPEQYGRCDRAIKCAYHLNPYSDGYTKLITAQQNDNHIDTSKGGQAKIRKPQISPISIPAPSFIPLGIFKQSRAGYNQNNFIIWLTDHFDTKTVNNLISRYHIGTSKHQFTNKDFPGYKSPIGATIFWQIDLHGKIRGGKIMYYSPTTGRRIKEPFDHITWAHSVLKLPVYKLNQCLFGEHLLKAEPTKPVALVESEKTAIIASVYIPGFIWLAVGGLTNLNKENCQVLAGRNVFLYPDLKAFEKWSAKAKEFSLQMPGTLFEVSDLLERHATEAERANGLDLADYLLRFDYRFFRQRQTNKVAAPILQLASFDTGEKGENSEGFKTINISQSHPEMGFLPSQTDNTFNIVPIQKEYYRYTYQELCQEIGSVKANQAVNRYQELSEQNATLNNWFFHACPLLTSYVVGTE